MVARPLRMRRWFPTVKDSVRVMESKKFQKISLNVITRRSGGACRREGDEKIVYYHIGLLEVLRDMSSGDPSIIFLTPPIRPETAIIHKYTARETGSTK